MQTRRTNGLWLFSTVLLLTSCVDTRPQAGTPGDSTSPHLDGGMKSPFYEGDLPQGDRAEVDGNLGNPTDPSTVVTGPVTLTDALHAINQHIADGGLAMRRVTPDEMMAWFEDGKYFQWLKAERKTLEHWLALDQIPEGWTLRLEQVVPTLPWRVTLCAVPQLIQMGDGFGELQSCATVAEGENLMVYTEWYRSVCQDPSHDLCNDTFTGSLPSMESVELPSSIEVRVQPITVPGEPAVPEYAERDALDIQVLISPESIPAIVQYFAVGYEPAVLEARLRTLLGGAASKWVHLQEFLFGWIRERANTFPNGDDNDVCHGPARQFYNDTLYNGPSDRSTEATALYLHDHYCVIGDDVLPRFGDYFYNPGAHSARFVLMDPATHRDVVFSVQSGGVSAYRFWWADEDMSGKPFAHEPNSDYRQQLIDVWRRCR